VYVPRSRRIRDYPETILEAEFRPPLACLVRCLESSVARERAWALTAMGNLGKDALPVEHAMAAALHDPDMAVRLAAAMSLGRIGSTSIRTAGGLRLAFEDPCSQVAVEAHRSFLEIVLTGRQLNP
jgi:HEAT repeat protein